MTMVVPVRDKVESGLSCELGKHLLGELRRIFLNISSSSILYSLSKCVL